MSRLSVTQSRRTLSPYDTCSLWLLTHPLILHGPSHQTAAHWSVPVTAEEITEAKIKGDANNDWVRDFICCH